MSPDPEVSSAQWLRLAREAERAGDAPLAMSHVIEALAAARAARDLPGQVDALTRAGGICSGLDDFDGALVWLDEARDLVASLNDDERDWKVLNLLASVLGALKDFAQFFAVNALAAQVAERLSDPRPLAITRSNRAARLLDFGEFQRGRGDELEAVASFDNVLAITEHLVAFAEAAEDTQILFAAWANRGPALQQLGRDDEALAAIDRSDALAAAAGMHGAMANTAIYRARILAARGNHAAARSVSLQGIATGHTHGNMLGAADLHLFMSVLEENEGNLRAALDHHRRFHALQSATLSSSSSQRSKLLAVRLQTEHAQAEAAAERRRAGVLADANAALAERGMALALQAEQDPLTGLANRRRLDRHLAAAHADARARGVALCVALLDVDHFKQVNDRFSHATGDRVLQQIGTMLSLHSRSGDLAARYGGEEFVLVLTGVGASRATAVCERLRREIQAFDWAAIAPGLRVTASIGLADTALDSDPAVGLARADTCMYEAKQQGRNRVLGPR